MNKSVGIKDVAAAAGVSVTTVSHVLNDVAYARVGVETRERVHEAAQRLGSVAAERGTRAAVNCNPCWAAFGRQLCLSVKRTLP